MQIEIPETPNGPNMDPKVTKNWTQNGYRRSRTQHQGHAKTNDGPQAKDRLQHLVNQYNLEKPMIQLQTAQAMVKTHMIFNAVSDATLAGTVPTR